MNRLQCLADELERTAMRIESDEDLERSEREALGLLTRTAPRRFSCLSGRMILVAAAVLVLGAGIWRIYSMRLSGENPPSLAYPISADAKLSAPGQPTSDSHSSPLFSSGQPVHLQYSLEEPATVFVVRLDSKNRLSPVTETAAHLPRGRHELMLQLGAEPGVETLFVLASPGQLSTEAFLEALNAMSEYSLPDDPEVAASIARIVLRGNGRFGVKALTYLKGPRVQVQGAPWLPAENPKRLPTLFQSPYSEVKNQVQDRAN